MRRHGSLVAALTGILDSLSFPANAVLHQKLKLRAGPCSLSFHGTVWYSQNLSRVPNAQSTHSAQVKSPAQRRRHQDRKSLRLLCEFVPLRHLFWVGTMIAKHFEDLLAVVILSLIA